MWEGRCLNLMSYSVSVPKVWTGVVVFVITKIYFHFQALHIWMVYTKRHLEDQMDAQASLPLPCCGGDVLWTWLGWFSVERKTNWMCVKIGKSQVQCLFAAYEGFISGRSLIEVHDCILCFILNIGTVNSSLNGYLYKNGHPTKQTPRVGPCLLCTSSSWISVRRMPL